MIPALNLIILSLLLVNIVHIHGACNQTQQDAESSCKASNNCTTCSDFNYNGYPDACRNNAKVHCLEIEW